MTDGGAGSAVDTLTDYSNVDMLNFRYKFVNFWQMVVREVPSMRRSVVWLIDYSKVDMLDSRYKFVNFWQMVVQEVPSMHTCVDFLSELLVAPDQVPWPDRQRANKSFYFRGHVPASWGCGAKSVGRPLKAGTCPRKSNDLFAPSLSGQGWLSDTNLYEP